MHEDRARKGIDTASFRKRFAQIVSALHSAGCGRTRPGVTSRYSTDRFIGDLDRALMRLTDPKDIVAVTVRTLGHYLGLDRCVYAEVEADQDHVVTEMAEFLQFQGCRAARTAPSRAA